MNSKAAFILFRSITCQSLELDSLSLLGDNLIDNGLLSKLPSGLIPDRLYCCSKFINDPFWSECFLNYIKAKKLENWAYGDITNDNYLTLAMGIDPNLEPKSQLFKVNSSFNNTSSNHLISNLTSCNNCIDPKTSPIETVVDIQKHLSFLINNLESRHTYVSDIPMINKSLIYKDSILKMRKKDEIPQINNYKKLKLEQYSLLMESLGNWKQFNLPKEYN